MQLDGLTQQFENFLAPLTPNWNNTKAIAIFVGALVIALAFNRLMEWWTPRLAESLSKRVGTSKNSEKFLRTRRFETFLSLGTAIGRVIIIGVALLVAWRLTSPAAAPIAIIGASTVFIILASATVVPLLRDITYGFIMIAEQWYNVGDHVVLEPFPNLGGVVEHVTMRSTKLRSMNGEIIWVHNQHIQAVRVSAAASHTVALEIFVSDPVRGQKIVSDAIKIIPSSSITTPYPLAISEVKEIEAGLWRITAICEVTPFREWIIEDFALKVIKTNDERAAEPTIVHGPIAYYADTTAEKRFRRSVQGRAVTSRPIKTGRVS